ncbi:hypothetical protein [Crassaminicella thermophila]|uniref:hypothetical protein n=1 Tax=Crassaminicella thermophila TaxID=2599308 RepID=UPI00143DC20C|nr:hypothetical protein [Crassaminicella thermophila]
MSRVERKKLEKNIKKSNKKRIKSRFICILFLIFLLISGIWIVDNSFRSMMMLKEPKVFGFNKINERMYEISFCGDKFYIDEQKIYDTYRYVKNEINGFVEVLIKNKRPGY